MAEITKNTDGSCVVKLSGSIHVGGEEISRVTIPAIKGKHMRSAPFSAGVNVTLGHLVTFAAEIIQPAGSVDEMSPDDAIYCAQEVAALLNKSAG